MVNLASFMTKVIRDTGTLVLIKPTVTDQEPIITTLWIFKCLHKAKTWYHRPLQKGQFGFFFYTLKSASEYSPQIQES